jgi:hypothetical protein
MGFGFETKPIQNPTPKSLYWIFILVSTFQNHFCKNQNQNQNPIQRFLRGGQQINFIPTTQENIRKFVGHPAPGGGGTPPFRGEGCRMKSESKTQNRNRKPNTKPTPNFQNIFSYPNEKIFAKTNTKLSDHFQKIFVFDFGFNFHISFSKPFSQTKTKIQYKHFWQVGNRLFSYPL